jgi:hypothetical protein
MKLYTEEQVKSLLDKMEVIYSLEALKPIKLPSEEEIDEELPNGLEGNYVSGFYDGVDWLINHIKQQDNGK